MATSTTDKTTPRSRIARATRTAGTEAPTRTTESGGTRGQRRNGPTPATDTKTDREVAPGAPLEASPATPRKRAARRAPGVDTGAAVAVVDTAHADGTNAAPSADAPSSAAPEAAQIDGAAENATPASVDTPAITDGGAAADEAGNSTREDPEVTASVPANDIAPHGTSALDADAEHVPALPQDGTDAAVTAAERDDTATRDEDLHAAPPAPRIAQGAVAAAEPAPATTAMAGPLEFSVQPHHLQMGLAAVGGAIPSRTTLPALSMVRIAAEGDNAIRLTATDLDTTVSRVIPAVITGGGAVLVAGKKLQEIVREVPANCPLDLRLLGETMHIACASTRTRFKLNTLPADDFPTPPKVAWADGFTVPGPVLTVLIERSSYAASTEETRPILNGVLWEFGETRMGMVATNGHRLASVGVATEARDDVGQVIMHPRSLAIVKAQPAEGEPVRVARSDNHIGFRGDGWEIVTRLIEGPYPNYQQVIPKDNDKVMIVDKGVLRAAVRRMAIVASDQTHRIRLSLAGTSLKLSVETPDLGAGDEEVPIEYEGDPIDIGFNAQYLLELLRHMPTDEVRMTFKAPERAATIEPVTWEEGWDAVTLLMPLRLLS